MVGRTFWAAVVVASIVLGGVAAQCAPFSGASTSNGDTLDAATSDADNATLDAGNALEAGAPGAPFCETAETHVLCSSFDGTDVLDGVWDYESSADGGGTASLDKSFFVSAPSSFRSFAPGTDMHERLRFPIPGAPGKLTLDLDMKVDTEQAAAAAPGGTVSLFELLCKPANYDGVWIFVSPPSMELDLLTNEGVDMRTLGTLDAKPHHYRLTVIPDPADAGTVAVQMQVDGKSAGDATLPAPFCGGAQVNLLIGVASGADAGIAADYDNVVLSVTH